MRGNRAQRANLTQGSTGGRGEMEGLEGEEWVYPLLKRVVRRALLEVLSRRNGATEANIKSITSVSLTYSPLLSLSFSLHLSVSVAIPHSPKVITSQSADHINGHQHKPCLTRNCDLWWKMSFLMAVMSHYLLPREATHMTHNLRIPSLNPACVTFVLYEAPWLDFIWNESSQP